MNKLLQANYLINQALESFFALLRPFTLLVARGYIAWIFFPAGLTKIRDWDTTLFLFEEEYSVPFISPTLAAYLGTGAELILPLFLLIGLFSPLVTLGLLIVNAVAVLSLEVIAPAAFLMHVIWGLLLMILLLWGPGRVSLDRIIKARATR